jgi:class 3 adenylate cyclase
MTTCPNCGNGLVDQPRFCPECGHRLTDRATTQEFRIVTVVFCDVVKSTELERELDPLPMQRLLDRYGQAVRGALGDRGASVGKRHGDGFMAAFGVPELHEDDALRAVRAAGELRTNLDELAKEVREQRGLEFHVRLGINTGNVLVRDAGTLEEELTGTPVNLAKRFEELAGAGEILLGEETYRLVADATAPAGPGGRSRRWSGGAASSSCSSSCSNGRAPKAPATWSACSARPGSGSPGWSTSSWPA